MLDPSDLLAAARLLMAGGASPPSQAQIRRAVSTAYYALFHHVLRAAARHFAGHGGEGSPTYVLIYRGFTHGRMKAACKLLDVPKFGKELEWQLGRTSMGQEARNFASAFIVLQEARHLADYHPTADFAQHDVEPIVEATADAMAAFDRIDPDERAVIMPLMLVSPRG